MESRESVLKELTEYVQEHLLDGDRSVGLTTETPLLEWGVLRSIDTARLVGYIRQRFGVRIPPTQIVHKHFKNIESIADLMASLSEAEGEPGAPGRGKGGQDAR